MTAATARALVWFSCGAASAAAAKLAIEKYGDAVEVLYCDTFAYEHPDNRRFFNEVQAWLGQEIKILRSETYADIYDVFTKTRYLVGPRGARCTTELKKKVRFAYERPGDIHVIGYTSDEIRRIKRFEENNPDLSCDWILADRNISKRECLLMLRDAGIELPAMYRLGYKNNNCIGCVKGGAGYWNKIRVDFPEMFAKMAATERDLGISILRRNGDRLFLDELPPDMGNYPNEPDISCGVQCSLGLEAETK